MQHRAQNHARSRRHPHLPRPKPTSGCHLSFRDHDDVAQAGLHQIFSSGAMAFRGACCFIHHSRTRREQLYVGKTLFDLL